MLKIIDPTGKGIRQHDAWGSGKFKAPRGEKRHEGVDFICKPGQKVIAPIGGRVLRHAWPYSGDTRYSGLFIQNDIMWVKMFYLQPDEALMRKIVKAGRCIGTAQDISKRRPYPGMIPHIHLEYGLFREHVLVPGDDSIIIDPEILL